MSRSARILAGLPILASIAPNLHAQCDYRENLAPLESIEGFENLTPEQIEGLRAMREALAASFGRADDETLIQSREENQRIRAVLDGNTEQVFFLEIFGGHMPVPNRFVATGAGVFGTTWGGVLPSPDSPGPDELAPELDGNIRFGSRSELSLPSQEAGDLCEAVVSTRHGLNVETCDARCVMWAVVYDDNEFLSIMDNNHTLWESMLDVWYELGSRRSR
jgi:hypothetical protein